MPPRRRPSPKAGAKRQRSPSQLSNPEPMAPIYRHNVCSPLMAVYTTAVMKPKHQSTIRKAGSVGLDIYEEVVAQGLAGTHLVLGYHIDGSDKKQHAPYGIQPLQKNAFDNDDVLAIAPSDLEMLRDQGGRNRIRSHVKRIQLTGFDHVTSTDWQFMSGCSSLATIELSPLSNLTSIGSCFMKGCTSLKAIEFSPMPNLTSIDSCFMEGCTSLEAINISPMSNLTSIDSCFMKGCTSLKAIEFSPMPNLTKIDREFMKDCISLRAIDMNGLVNVAVIGHHCLSHCYQLKTIEMSALTKLSLICFGFAYYCVVLTVARLPPGCEVHLGMFDGCSSMLDRCEGHVEAQRQRCERERRHAIMMGR